MSMKDWLEMVTFRKTCSGTSTNCEIGVQGYIILCLKFTVKLNLQASFPPKISVFKLKISVFILMEALPVKLSKDFKSACIILIRLLCTTGY